MFKECKNEYIKSEMGKKDKIYFEKQMQKNLEQAYDDGKYILEDSVVDKIELTHEGINIILDVEHMSIKMRINEKDYEQAPNLALCFGSYEKYETNMCLKILERLDSDSICFDIGANVGWYSLNIQKKFSEMKVYTFEPSPVTFERLKRNLELNLLDTSRCFNIGFYKEKGQMDFYFDPEGTGASSLVNIREREMVQKINVGMVRMDEWIKEHEIKRLDFIKCDVEGSELFVYQGGSETIKKYKPVIFSEMLRKWSAKFGYHPNNIIEIFRNIDYRCFIIEQKNNLKEILEVTEETEETNYFFLHKEKHAKIIRDLEICK